MNIGIDGFGSIGKRHFGNLKKTGNHNFFIKRRKDDGSLHNEKNVQVITDFKEIENEKLDILFVCTPTAKHIDALPWAVEKGLHIFMEKPLTHNDEGLKTAIQYMQRNKKVFFIGYMLRYHPAIARIKEMINNETFGKVIHAHFSFGYYLPFWQPHTDYKESYAANKNAGGGVVKTISHETDLMQFFFGDPAYVFCASRNFNYLKIDAEEMADAIFQYDSFTVTMHIDYLQKTYHRSIRVICENGTINWTWQQNEIVVHEYQKEKLTQKVILPDVNALYIEEIKDFFLLIHENKINHPLDFNHAVNNMKLLNTMHASTLQKCSLPFEPYANNR